MVRWIVVATLAGALAAGCKHKDPSGLPPAKDWGASPAGAVADQPTESAQPGAEPASAEQLPPGHPAMPAGHPSVADMGGAGGTDVSKMGLPAPDPNRPIDPTHHVSGMIKLHPKTAAKVQAGTAVFVVVKAADASGQASGPPLAVQKLSWPASGDLPFNLTEADAMIGGTQLTGNVVITAHYDQDSDALSKQPGDILGEAKVTVPADNVTLYLDQVL